jgi:hypothetical protein
VPAPDDQGLLSTSTDNAGNSVTVGSGIVSSVRYSAGTMSVVLQPPDGGTSPVATLYVTLPSMYAVPLTMGQSLQVLIVDASTAMNMGDTAITLRDGAGNLILVADSALGGAVLSAAQTAPFSVAASQDLVGCDEDGCGKLLHFNSIFTGGPNPIELTGGQSLQVIVAQREYQLLNVADDAYATTTACMVQKLMPYAILYQPGP